MSNQASSRDPVGPTINTLKVLVNKYLKCYRTLWVASWVVNGEDMENHFDDLETGMSSEDETFITIAEFVVTVKRTAQGAHA